VIRLDSLTRLGLAALGALIITGALLAIAAQLVSERPSVQDLTSPVAVSLVIMPQEDKAPEPERQREPEPPKKPPTLEFAPQLPMPSLGSSAPAGVVVNLDPSLFSSMAPMGDLVFNAGDLDQPPRATVKTAANYPYRARQRRIEGTVTVRFLVRRDGTVGEVIIESADPAGVFDQAVLDAVSNWRFEPGRLSGEAVAAWVRQPLVFKLDGGRR